MDITASEAGCPSLIPPNGGDATGSTPESLCQQIPIHGDAIPPEMEPIPTLLSTPALHTEEVQDPGSVYTDPQRVSNPPPDIQAVTGNCDSQEHPPPSYDSVVPVQPFLLPVPMQYPPQQPLSAYPTNYCQQSIHPPQQPIGVLYVQMPSAPCQGAVVQQPRPQDPRPIKTENQVNQLHLAICLIIFMFFNPLALPFALCGLYFAYKAASENRQNLSEEAHKHHRTAQYCNVCALVNGIIYYVLGVGMAIWLGISLRP